MYTSNDQIPDLQTLVSNLSSVLKENKATKYQVTILARESNPYASTFPSEIVTCQLAEGSTLQILCKYEAGQNHNSYGHRGGISYEAEVYKHILEQVPIRTPTYYGDYKDKISGETWLFLEHFAKLMPLRCTSDLAVIRAAASWLGKFHKANESLLSEASIRFLNRHDADYYIGWAKRTMLYVGNLHQHYPWLEMLCKQYEKTIVTFLESPVVIIHGEYYPENILFFEHKIYPVDWESAAVAIGEIDLTSLTENWPVEFANEAKEEYQLARWPEGTPAGFEQKIEAAQLYWHFRWLGDQSEWSQDKVATNQTERLLSLGELGKQFGLI